MATATLIKGFTHDGKIYKEGDQFEGSDYEIELLTRQKFVAPKKDKSADSAADQPGKGYNTSESSSGSAHVHYPEGSVPGQATQAGQTQATHHKK